MKLHILTAYTQDYENVGNLCYDSILRYGRHHDIAHSNTIIPEDYARPASWFKLEAVRRKLPDYDYVLWLDADAMIIGRQDVREIIQPSPLNLSADANGLNFGIVAFKNCPEAFEVLDRAELLYPKFADHPWFEQAAVQSFSGDIRLHVQPQEIWNAYPREVEGGSGITGNTLFCHWPGVPFREKIAWMKFMEVKATILHHL